MNKHTNDVHTNDVRPLSADTRYQGGGIVKRSDRATAAFESAQNLLTRGKT